MKKIATIEWLVILTVILVDCELAKLSGIPVDAPRQSILLLTIIVSLWPLTALVTRATGFAVGSDFIAENAAKFFVFIGAVSALEYYIAGFDTPLQDDLMVRIDAMLGFHWPDFFAWAESHKAIERLMGYAYVSLMYQAGIVLFAIAVIYPHRASFFVTSFIISALITMFLYAVAPVAGPFVTFHHTDLPRAFYTDHYLQMRAHALPAIPMGDIRGIVSFPSFHVSSAVIMTYFLRRLSVISWLALLLNMGMAVAALVVGGHYLIDVLAGIAVGVATVAIIHWMENKTIAVMPRPEPSRR